MCFNFSNFMIFNDHLQAYKISKLNCSKIVPLLTSSGHLSSKTTLITLVQYASYDWPQDFKLYQCPFTSVSPKERCTCRNNQPLKFHFAYTEPPLQHPLADISWNLQLNLVSYTQSLIPDMAKCVPSETLARCPAPKGTFKVQNYKKSWRWLSWVINNLLTQLPKNCASLNIHLSL